MNITEEIVEKCKNAKITSLENYKDLIKEIKELANKIMTKNRYKKPKLIYYRGDTENAKINPKIDDDDNLKKENEMFDEWIHGRKNNECNYCKNCEPGSFECLANMQHYGSENNRYKTRLLDFTSDPYVALRFACGPKGEKEGKDRFISIYITTDEVINSKDDELNEYLDLVKDSYQADKNRNVLSDCFIEFHPSVENNLSERIKRQKGLFLLFGQDKKSEEKRIKKLSIEDGRGRNYEGCFAQIKILKEYIDGIREELEAIDKYKMDYLMNNNKGK